jgi:hypothetical protein
MNNNEIVVDLETLGILGRMLALWIVIGACIEFLRWAWDYEFRSKRRKIIFYTICGPGVWAVPVMYNTVIAVGDYFFIRNK